jgi:hypothetical protein
MARREYTDEELRRLYEEWSEEYYCAGWMICDSPRQAEAFVDWLLRGPEGGRAWEDYEHETITHIRAVLSTRTDGGEA